MKKHLLILLLLMQLLPVHPKAQIKDKETYKVISAWLSDTLNIRYPYSLEVSSLPFNNSSINMEAVLNRPYLKDPPVMFADEVRLDTFLTDEDILFMEKKAVDMKEKLKWDLEQLHIYNIPHTGMLKSDTVLPFCHYWVRMCPPLFSPDRKKAILYAECNAEGVGSGNIFIYQKKEKSWVLVSQLPVWIE